MPHSIESLESEETRLQATYARRRTGHLYSRFNPAHLFMAHEREKRFLKLLFQHGYSDLGTRKILEIGCGTGDLLRDLVKWGANPEYVSGIDVLPERVAEAVRLCPARMCIRQANAAKLDFPSEQFDLVIQSTVFTSVLDSEITKQIAAEMCRVLKTDGLILWYDFHMSNPRNPNVQGVSAKEVSTLFSSANFALSLLPWHRLWRAGLALIPG